MKTIKYIIIGLFYMLCCIPPQAVACTSFHMSREEGHFVAKNYDWFIGNGLAIVNKRGLQKQAHEGSDPTAGQPARWTSKYGSITFNQYGRELPMGGINEAGLVVEVLLLGQTRYPDPDERPCVSMLQWVQYQLDTAATTGEVLSGMDAVRIFSDGRSPGMHYFVCDRSGTCAVVEYLDGKPVIYTGDRLPVHALANSTYANALASLQRLAAAKADPPWGDRFATAGLLLEKQGERRSPDGVAQALEILDRVSQGAFTQWRIVYDLHRRVVYFATSASGEVRRVALDAFDFSCETPVQVLDLYDRRAGDAAPHFSDYSRQINFAMIQQSFRSTSFVSNTPAEKLNRLADYPDESVCGPHQ